MLTYEVVKCRYYMGEWLAEAIDMESEGECYAARFSGQGAEDRAREYAEWKNAAVATQPVTN